MSTQRYFEYFPPEKCLMSVLDRCPSLREFGYCKTTDKQLGPKEVGKNCWKNCQQMLLHSCTFRDVLYL